MDSLISLEQIEKGLEIKQSIDKILKSYKEDGSINTSIIKTPAEPGDPLTGKPGKPAVTYTLEEYLEIIKKQLDSIIAPSGGSTDDSGGGSSGSGGSGSESGGSSEGAGSEGSSGGETIVKILSLKEVSQKIGNLLKNIKFENDDLILVKDDNTTENVSLSALKYTHPKSGVKKGQYTRVQVDDKGHVISADNPNTLEEYNISDAKISDGTIILGKDRITPLTENSLLRGDMIAGKIPLGNMPKESFVKILTVDNDNRRYHINKNEVKEGDIVKVLDTEIMYLVINKNEIDNDLGWLPFGSATSYTAVHDVANQQIDTTYIKNITLKDSILTYSKGDGTRIVVPFEVMQGSNTKTDGRAGIVPAPTKGSQEKFMRGDGTWAKITDNPLSGDIVFDTKSFYSIAGETKPAKCIYVDEAHVDNIHVKDNVYVNGNIDIKKKLNVNNDIDTNNINVQNNLIASNAIVNNTLNINGEICNNNNESLKIKNSIIEIDQGNSTSKITGIKINCTNGTPYYIHLGKNGALQIGSDILLNVATEDYVDHSLPIALNAPPLKKVIGTVWFDTAEKIIKYWNGTEWVPFGAAYL